MILSLFDYTGYMGRDWKTSVIVDIQHTQDTVNDAIALAWNVLKAKQQIIDLGKELGCTLLTAFPPCTDLAVSGAAHFALKRLRNPAFQQEAMELLFVARDIGEALNVPYMIENPVSVISTLWRKPDYIFHPWEYSGYLPITDKHPDYPQFIRPRDQYPKKTCLWTGGGFRLPPKKPVLLQGYISALDYVILGGKSQRVKNIRSATPRGFARAVFEMYGDCK